LTAARVRNARPDSTAAAPITGEARALNPAWKRPERTIETSLERYRSQTVATGQRMSEPPLRTVREQSPHAETEHAPLIRIETVELPRAIPSSIQFRQLAPSVRHSLDTQVEPRARWADNSPQQAAFTAYGRFERGENDELHLPPEAPLAFHDPWPQLEGVWADSRSVDWTQAHEARERILQLNAEQQGLVWSEWSF